MNQGVQGKCIAIPPRAAPFSKEKGAALGVTQTHDILYVHMLYMYTYSEPGIVEDSESSQSSCCVCAEHSSDQSPGWNNTQHLEYIQYRVYNKLILVLCVLMQY